MHDTAMIFGERFFKTYVGTRKVKVIDIGAQDVNGSLRSVVPAGCEYIGVDFADGKGVDVIIEDPYQLPFDNESADIVVSSSCFEHSEFFWLLFLEIMRILKTDGLFYLNAPSNGVFHRYPVDCWRFYPDSGNALANWGKRNGIPVALIESFTGFQKNDVWNDFVAVFIKDESQAGMFPNRIIGQRTDYQNGISYPEISTILNHAELPEDLRHRFFKRLKKRLFPSKI